ncbi:MAG: hypothetical protein WD595_06930 [Waddliaceae bacterium]
MSISPSGGKNIYSFVEKISQGEIPSRKEKNDTRVEISAFYQIHAFQFGTPVVLEKKLINNIKIIANSNIPKQCFIIKLIQDLAYYITLGRYDSEYIASRKLKEVANQFIKSYGENLVIMSNGKTDDEKRQIVEELSDIGDVENATKVF